MSTPRSARTLMAACVGGGGVLALLAASPAAAHTGRQLTGVVDGVLHPLSGADHLLAMLTVGALAALTIDRRRAWALPVAFVGAMVLGGAAGIAAGSIGGLELAIAASLVVLGALLTREHAEVTSWLLGATMVAGALHGQAHGVEVSGAANPLTYVAGFVLTTATLHALGAVAGVGLRRTAVARLAAGATVSAMGMMLLVGA